MTFNVLIKQLLHCVFGSVRHEVEIQFFKYPCSLMKNWDSMDPSDLN